MKRIFAIFFISFLVFSCAKIVTPSGGKKDTTPPEFVESKPYQNSVNFKDKEIKIEFDEYIVLENPINKVLISPQIQPTPEIVSNLKSIHVKGLDSLKENTTYIIDFADAIKDYNEGNRLNGFSFAFSTGNHIDTLWYEGKVLEAFELKPIANRYVLLYSTFDTSYMKNNPADYLTKTDSNGVFRFHNLADKKYKLLILDDKNQNKIYDLPNEGIGFSNEILIPYISDSTSNEKLLKQKFYYTEFKEEQIEDKKSQVRSLKKDTIFNIPRVEKDTVDYYKGAYTLIMHDTLQSETIPALLIQEKDSLQAQFAKTNDSIYSLEYALETGKNYEIIINKGVATTIHNQINTEYKHRFYYSTQYDYGNLIINIKDSVENCYVLYLCKPNGEIAQEKTLLQGEKKVLFDNVKEGAYRLKISIDRNCNKKWDKANFSKQEEAEKVLLFDKVLSIKKAWTIEEEWNISE